MTEEQINILIGQNLTKARERAGYKLKDLAELVGVTYQQVQKYEKGKNRLTAAKLVMFARALLVEPSELLPEAF